MSEEQPAPKRPGSLGRINLFGRQFELGVGAGLGIGGGIDGPGGTGLKCGIGMDPFQRCVGFGCGVRLGVVLGIDLGVGVGIPLFSWSPEQDPDWRALGGAAADFVVSKLTGGERIFTVGDASYRIVRETQPQPQPHAQPSTRFTAGAGDGRDPLASVPSVVAAVARAAAAGAAKVDTDGPVGSGSASLQ
eukprot:tig00020629_g12453.t1